jgi:hypothetical protein
LLQLHSRLCIGAQIQQGLLQPLACCRHSHSFSTALFSNNIPVLALPPPPTPPLFSLSRFPYILSLSKPLSLM